MTPISVTWPYNQWSAQGFHAAIDESADFLATKAFVTGRGTAKHEANRQHLLKEWLAQAIPAGNA